MRSLAVEGTVGFLVVSAIISAPLTYYPGSQFLLVGILFAVTYAVIAYVCWKQIPAGFIAAIILALFAAASAVGISGLRYAGDELLVVVQLLIVFFSYRGYREVRRVHRSGRNQ